MNFIILLHVHKLCFFEYIQLHHCKNNNLIFINKKIRLKYIFFNSYHLVFFYFRFFLKKLFLVPSNYVYF